MKGPAAGNRTPSSDSSEEVHQPGPLRVGFVNNMPDGAFASSEDQFLSLLTSGSPTEGLSFRLYSLEGIPRSEAVAAKVRSSYLPVEDLFSWSPDLVVITGSEPLAPSLPEETYWQELIGIIEWATGHARGLLLSCLSAHAALLHLEGLPRVRLPSKCSGVFAHHVDLGHTLAPGLRSRLEMPHSRLNGVPTAALGRLGYEVVIDSDIGWGVVSRSIGGCQVLLFQGHPEYGADTLFREYRRDVFRYMSGESALYPEIPSGYLDEEATLSLAAFRQRYIDMRQTACMSAFPFEAVASRLGAPWSAPAARLTSNWIGLTSRRGQAPKEDVDIHAR